MGRVELLIARKPDCNVVGHDDVTPCKDFCAAKPCDTGQVAEVEEKEDIELGFAIFEDAELTGLCFGVWSRRLPSSPQEGFAEQALLDGPSSQLGSIGVVEGNSAPVKAQCVVDFVGVVGEYWDEAVLVAERVSFESPPKLLDE